MTVAQNARVIFIKLENIVSGPDAAAYAKRSLVMSIW